MTTNALEASQQLVIVLYATFRNDPTLSRDMQMALALQRSALSLVSFLAQAAAATHPNSRAHCMGLARQQTAAFEALLDVAERVQAMSDESYAELAQAAGQVKTVMSPTILP